MADATYTPKVYMMQGGDEQVVASGGAVTVESSGAINVESGGEITVESGGGITLEAGSTFTLPVVAKTASYALLATDMNKIFTTRGAEGAVTFTLPAVATAGAGAWVEFYNVADQDMIIDGPDEGLVVFNDATADSIAVSTAGEQIGGAFRAVCDGTSWIVVPMCTETQTVTVASA